MQRSTVFIKDTAPTIPSDESTRSLPFKSAVNMKRQQSAYQTLKGSNSLHESLITRINPILFDSHMSIGFDNVEILLTDGDLEDDAYNFSDNQSISSVQ